jgi:HAD superfamily hydrolase (TIGR01450 family)
VVWRGDSSIPGAAEAIAELRRRDVALAFVTNSALRTPAQVAAKLASHGVPDAADLVVTAGTAAATMVRPGDRVLPIGADGVRAPLVERGAELVEGSRGDRVPDAVVVGISFTFDYDDLTRAMRAIRAGARFIATNDDVTFPDADGLLPGNGSLVAAVAAAAGVSPEIAGKPHPPIAALTRARLGTEGIMVGDRPDTDGEFAAALGYRFGLVLTGVTDADDLPVDPRPDRVANDLRALVTDVTAGPDRRRRPGAGAHALWSQTRGGSLIEKDDSAPSPALGGGSTRG